MQSIVANLIKHEGIDSYSQESLYLQMQNLFIVSDGHPVWSSQNTKGTNM